MEVSIICSFFRYDLKLGFPLVFNLFARCGPIFIKKLLNCFAISFIFVILVSFRLKCRKLFLYYGFVDNISYVFPCFPDVIPVFTKLQVTISSLCFSF